jgi:cyclic pyranopterin phosphate synthase
VSLLRDAFGRRIDYLRISVTDRCNLRCVYCMPPAGIAWRPRTEVLSFEEIVRVVAIAAELGIRQIRLTGGEPLVRRDLPQLVRAIAHIPGIEAISLTTNGMLLDKLAAPLADAGLMRVNISLDTLDPEKFRRLTRLGEIERLWRGVEAAERAGLTPLKFNAVVIRGVNEMELPALARLTMEQPWHVRFIELMPVGNGEDWGGGFPLEGDRYVSVREMRAILAPLDLTPTPGPMGNGPARTFRILGALGTVGFISPLGEHFCATCNRLRLTADGRLRPCLLRADEVPVREALRQGGDIARLIRQAVALKPSGHTLTLSAASLPQNRTMCQIGG